MSCLALFYTLCFVNIFPYFQSNFQCTDTVINQIKSLLIRNMDHIPAHGALSPVSQSLHVFSFPPITQTPSLISHHLLSSSELTHCSLHNLLLSSHSVLPPPSSHSHILPPPLLLLNFPLPSPLFLAVVSSHYTHARCIASFSSSPPPSSVSVRAESIVLLAADLSSAALQLFVVR